MIFMFGKDQMEEKSNKDEEVENFEDETTENLFYDYLWIIGYLDLYFNVESFAIHIWTCKL